MKRAGSQPNRPAHADIPANRKPGFATRAAATKILGAVVDRATPLDGMIDSENGNGAYRSLSKGDQALCRALILTALRHKPQIDVAISGLLDRPLPAGARALSHVLTIAAAQILYLDVPDHSAVDIAVEQANADPRNKRFAGLVNAVLRRLGRGKDKNLARIADVASMPDWFFNRLENIYGPEKAMAISNAQLTPPSIDLSVKADPEGWAAKLGGTFLPTGSVRLDAPSGAIPEMEGFDTGEWWVQDAAAAIPAKLFGDLSGQRVIDLCAAPGGKTAQLICQGGEVTALERSKSRLKRLEQNLMRLQLPVQAVAADMMEFQPEDGLYDAALLDAPCSSTGTTRRHPDVLWTKTIDDIEKLAEVQYQMLRRAIDFVRPGGIVIFSNCSLDPKEGEEVVERLINDGAPAERTAFPAGQLASLTHLFDTSGALRTTPADTFGDGATGLDGFYAAALKRL
ncbi:RsmB/NOP family class I SAM-dependent RNA methyltransferase [Martelella mediterranea]|uniref:16S rRNA (Cytosine967-C5)-methyltransferase n=1 Tax=Martelella mediterranea TaxID=293089 RepID=A0A4R3NVW0_9HYPH|nr:RsmB/NOP family class I SAM-dependent RNA methyltransferase [Martelella mediterranea]TCT41064.1 16S rRNA (cytosine967-C5)-methyltransferase [Martelella mediterranea]